MARFDGEEVLAFGVGGGAYLVETQQVGATKGNKWKKWCQVME